MIDNISTIVVLLKIEININDKRIAFLINFFINRIY